MIRPGNLLIIKRFGETHFGCNKDQIWSTPT